MAIQDLGIFTMLGVFVVLPSFTLSRSYYIVMVYLRLFCSDVLLLWYAVLTRVRCRGLFYVSPPCPGVHPHGSRVVAHLQPLCWGFFSSFEVTWSGVRPVLNVSFVFCGFTLWLRWSFCADTRAGCLRKPRCLFSHPPAELELLCGHDGRLPS